MTHLNVPIYISKDLTPSEQLKAFELRNQLRNHKVLSDNDTQRNGSIVNNKTAIATTACVQ